MESYLIKMGIRWADLDPNFHVLHAKYYDFGATCRMAFLVEHGLTPQVMQEHKIGPILLREDCTFRKELRFGDEISINLKLTKMTHCRSRWSMVHEVFKQGDILSAVMHIDAAWMDTEKRKLVTPPDFVTALFDQAPRDAGFQFTNR